MTKQRRGVEVECVDCGWRGPQSELRHDRDDGEEHCPVCDSVAGLRDVKSEEDV